MVEGKKGGKAGRTAEFWTSEVQTAEVLKYALVASARGQAFEDVKFYAFSRRNHSDTVDTPLPVYANSTLVKKASPHFQFRQ